MKTPEQIEQIEQLKHVFDYLYDAEITNFLESEYDVREKHVLNIAAQLYIELIGPEENYCTVKSIATLSSSTDLDEKLIHELELQL